MAERRRSRQAPEERVPIADKHRKVVPSRRPCSVAFQRASGPRPTSKYLALAQLLLARPHRPASLEHVNARVFPQRATQANVGASLASIYKTLNQFREGRLLRDIALAAPHAYFETNTIDHHDFLLDDKQPVIDIRCSVICTERIAGFVQIDPRSGSSGTKRMGQALPVPPDGRGIWKPQRPSSHVRHAIRVYFASAQT
ncbi:hypothetical protein DPM33_33755 [Mesorhizobium hawassense]|uniref:Uncharacterized protein n=1 Tax=Mesorhizobium hawassense TaxID=1209954 RepID=A0A330H8J6_9HYPH|nr:hypothetical protein DPM33_33755 [Mesorhizobium hawassense]